MILKNKIKKIYDAIKDTDIEEIEISTFWGTQKIKLKRNIYGNKVELVKKVSKKKTIAEYPDFDKDNVEQSSSQSNEVDEVEVLEKTSDENISIMKAPLVGTFYICPKPGDPVFVELNSQIKSGDTLCIIEAMKIFNEIESEYSGIVKEILVENGQPVEFGQPLFKIQET